jgi:hypothetical protein
MSDKTRDERQVWMEESEIPASQVASRVQELMRERNVQRILVRNMYDEVMVDIPLPVGVFFGGMMMVFAPGLVGLGGIGVLLSHVKIQVIREGEPQEHAMPKTAQAIDEYEYEELDAASSRVIDDEMGGRRRMASSPVTEEETHRSRVRVARPFGEETVRTTVRVSSRQGGEEPEVTRVRMPRGRPEEPVPDPAMDEEPVGTTRVRMPRGRPEEPVPDPAMDEEPVGPTRVRMPRRGEYEEAEEPEPDEANTHNARGGSGQASAQQKQGKRESPRKLRVQPPAGYGQEGAAADNNSSAAREQQGKTPPAEEE